MKLFEKIFGAEFLTSLAEVFNHLEGMQAGFHQRNREVVALLQSPNTAFFLVSYPSEVRYEESRGFIETLRDRRISLAAILLNRVETSSQTSPTELATLSGETRQNVEAILNFCEALRDGQAPWIERFQSFDLPCFTIEREENLSSLSKLIQFL